MCYTPVCATGARLLTPLGEKCSVSVTVIIHGEMIAISCGAKKTIFFIQFYHDVSDRAALYARCTATISLQKIWLGPKVTVISVRSTIVFLPVRLAAVRKETISSREIKFFVPARARTSANFSGFR